MNDFKKEYQSAVQDMDMLGMKNIRIDALSVMDERRHRRHMLKRARRMTAAAFSTVCVIFLCGFGTVKAAEYIGNVIKVNEWGFESGDAATMARSEAEGNEAYVLGDEVSLAMGDAPGAAEGAQPMAAAKLQEGDAGTGATGMRSAEEGTAPEEALSESQGLEEGAFGEPAGLSAESSEAEPEALASEAMVSGDLPGTEAERDALEKNGRKVQAGMEEGDGSIQAIPVKNYDSWEEFVKYEDIVFPQPSVSIGDAVTSTDITVCGDWAMVRYDVDGKVLWMERTDYSDTQGHASSKVFPGGVCNERSYTTPQGYIYTLVDSAKGEGDAGSQIHAAVTVGSYEAFIDFMGYTEEDAKEIMDSIDLSVYE